MLQNRGRAGRSPDSFGGIHPGPHRKTGESPQPLDISGAWASMKDGFYSGMEYMQKDITDIGKDMCSQWEALVAKIPSRTRYTANTPVSELEAALRAELAMEVVA